MTVSIYHSDRFADTPVSEHDMMGAGKSIITNFRFIMIKLFVTVSSQNKRIFESVQILFLRRAMFDEPQANGGAGINLDVWERRHAA